MNTLRVWSPIFLSGSWILLKCFQLYTRTAKLLLIWQKNHFALTKKNSIASNTVDSPTVLLRLSCHNMCGTYGKHPIILTSCVRTVLTRSHANQASSLKLVLFSQKDDCEIAHQ